MFNIYIYIFIYCDTSCVITEMPLRIAEGCLDQSTDFLLNVYDLTLTAMRLTHVVQHNRCEYLATVLFYQREGNYKIIQRP